MAGPNQFRATLFLRRRNNNNKNGCNSSPLQPVPQNTASVHISVNAHESPCKFASVQTSVRAKSACPQNTASLATQEVFQTNSLQGASDRPTVRTLRQPRRMAWRDAGFCSNILLLTFGAPDVSPQLRIPRGTNARICARSTPMWPNPVYSTSFNPISTDCYPVLGGGISTRTTHTQP